MTKFIPQPGFTLLFGGSFNPVHWGHLRTADAAQRELQAEQILFIPATLSPHKNADTLDNAIDRLNMLQLATAGHSGWDVCDLELNRPPPSFTWDTVQILRQKNPERRFVLLIGADQLPRFHTWKQWDDLVQAVEIAVLPRPGWPIPPSPPGNIPAHTWRKFHILGGPEYSISSSEIRRRAAAGLSIADLVPRAVSAYIAANKLYRHIG